MAGRRKKGGEEKGVDLIQIMTVSLFIILLAFFILLNALAVVDNERRRVALGSLMENFGILSGGYSMIRESGEDIPTEKISEITSLLDFSDMIKNDADPLNDLVVTSTPKRSVVTLPAHLLFEPGKTDLKPDSYPVLDRMCRLVRESKYSADIAGYASKDTGAADPSTTSRELSVLRALAVCQYFVDKGSVHPGLITSYGWGAYRPIASAKVRESKTLNQRIEVVIAHDKRKEKPEGFFTFKNFFFNVFDQ